LIYGQLRSIEGPTRKRKKKTNYLVGLSHYGRIYYSGCKFYVLTQVHTVCHYLFILLSWFYLFINIYGDWLIYFDTLIKFLIIISNILLHANKNNNNNVRFFNAIIYFFILIAGKREPKSYYTLLKNLSSIKLCKIWII
jgi:hypothetical protein